MGKYKFRLSEIIPAAWFYKLKDIGGRARSPAGQTKPPPPSPTTSPPSKLTQPPPHSSSRKSYHFNRQLDSTDGFSFNSPTKTKHCLHQKPERRRRRPPTRSATRSATHPVGGSAACICRTTAEPIDFPPEFSLDSSRTDTCLASDHDIVIDVVSRYDDVAGACHPLAELDLPPIITKHAKFSKRKETRTSSPGVRLRVNSPRISNRKINQANGRRSVSARRSISGSLAIVKSSYDPQRDFRESMVEMIVENNISASKDLEDLLACYLSLNADEYHEVIIKVFKQIWFDLTEC